MDTTNNNLDSNMDTTNNNLDSNMDTQSRNIIINFADSCYCVTMSYNDAIQSGYIKGLFSFNNNDDDDDDDEQSIINNNDDDEQSIINIPKELYIGIRKFDLTKLINIWLGNTEVYEHDRSRYCYRTIFRVADALLINKELPFMMELYNNYNKVDIFENLNIYM
jgi:hypothetical protein